MGGSSYDRDNYDSSSSSSWGSSYGGSSSTKKSSSSSSSSSRVFSSSSLDSSMLPNNKILESATKNPIIILLDVTGSNDEFARIVYDKLPMFFGQIEQKGYLKDFDIAICAVGDAYTDDYPLQVGTFARGIEIDSWLSKLVLEGGGGGQHKESYELAAYYLLKKAKFAPGSQPIIFFLGDEAPYPTVNKNQALSFGIDCSESVSNVFEQLRKKVNDNVFMLLSKYSGSYFDPDITNAWEKVLAPQHVIKVGEEKAIIDLMLGIISMVSSTRTLETYKVDMLDRGQTQARIANVSSSLDGLSKALVPVTVTSNIVKSDKTATSTQKGKRL